MAAHVLCGAAHVNYLQPLALFNHAAQFVNAHLRHASDFQSSLMPCAHAALQKSTHALVAYARQTYHSLFNLLLVVSNDDYRSVHWNERSRPRSKLPAESNVDRAGHMSPPESASRAHVQNCVTQLCKAVYFFGRKRVRLWQFFQGDCAASIYFSINRKVGGRFRQRSGHHANELVFRHRLKRVVELSLLAYC